MENIEKIERYLKGELSSSEKMEFEKRLASDKTLAEELAAFRQDELIIKSAVKRQLKVTAENALRNRKEKSVNRIIMMRKIAVAAGFALIVAIGIWWLNGTSGQDSTEQLVVQYFEMPIPPSVRDGNANVDEKWRQGVTYFKENKFENAIPVFKELILDENFDQRENAKLLLGSSLLATGKFDEAIIVFSEISDASSFKQDAEWYTAIALFKAGNISASKLAFEKIAAQKKHYKKRKLWRF